MYTNTGCKRLVDYYFVVSCSDHGKEQTKRRLCRHSLAPPHEKQARHALFALKPKIVDRYPSRSYSDTPLLPWVARASMPRGVRARTKPPAPRYFTFTGWNIDGSKLYGACLEVFEKMDIKKQRQPVYIPKTLGFISHYPYFYAFDVFLRCLWHVIPKKLIRLEDLLMHYFYDIPAPLPRKKIAYDLGKMKVLLACRNEFDVPIMELPIETPFTQLSKDRICMIIKLLLLEHRIVFVCTLVHELTPVCELFASLLFPLRWRHLFIPLVCRPMAEALKKMADYDHPFLVGLPRFVYVRPEISSSMPNNTYIVFLDRNVICDEEKNAIPSSCIPNLPSPLEENLRDSIHALARVLTMPDGAVSRDVILQAFRTMFAVITKLLFIANCNDNMTQEKEEKEKEKEKEQSFVSLFRQTNLFKSFKKYYNRVNPSDPQLKSIYPFFKQNEALGKHFARRSHSNSWSAGFDQSQYSRDAFRVNQDVIKRVEKQFAKKRADLAASNRNTTFSLPPEFEHLPQVKEFLKEYVFANNSSNKTNKNHNKNHRKNTHTKHQNHFANKTSKTTNKHTANKKHNTKSPHNKISRKPIIDKKKQSDKKKKNNDTKPKSSKSSKSSKLINKKIKSSNNNKSGKIQNNNKNNKEINNNKNDERDKKNDDNKKINGNNNNDDDDNDDDNDNDKDIVIRINNETTQSSKSSTNDKIKKNQTNDLIDGSENDGDVDGEHDEDDEDNEDNDDDDDDDDDDDENTSSASSSSNDSDDSSNDSDSDTDSDSSSWTEEDDDPIDEEEEWRASESNQSDLRRPSAAAVRHNRRFQNLNEFELSPTEKQWFVKCQKQHNSLIANIPEIKPIIAMDLFDDNIIKSWKSHQHKKMHKTYKKPKGS